MFAATSMPAERPVGWRSSEHHDTARSGQNSQSTSRSYSYDYTPRSIQNSPSVSRSSSVSSVMSAQTDPGAVSDRRPSSSATSADSNHSSNPKSGFKALFGKKEKKPKERKDVEKIVLTSKHAAAVKTKMMMVISIRISSISHRPKP